MINKIISGGQTGSDMGGLEAAKELKIETGGFAPKGFKTELGNNLLLASIYKLKEAPTADYSDRTKLNIETSDLTLIFSNLPKSKGTKFTQKSCEASKKPFLLVDPFKPEIEKIIYDFLKEERKKKGFNLTINIAGNRESKSPGIKDRVKSILINVVSNLKSK